MDSNKANVGTFYLTFIILILTAISVGFMAWAQFFPRASAPSGDLRAEFTIGKWIPIIILGCGFGLSLLLQIFLGLRLRKNKVLFAENSSLSKDLALARSSKVEIVSLSENDEVDLYENVRGYIFPPNGQLQLFVYAGDDHWYKQRSPNVTGTLWSATCQFGDPQRPSIGMYKVVAVFGNSLTESVYTELPNNAIKSKTVCVKRRLEPELESIERERNSLQNELSKLKETIAFSKKQHDAELATVNTDLRLKQDEVRTVSKKLDDANRRAHNSETENLRLKNEVTLATPNKRLIDVANNDAAEIQNAVTVAGVQFRNEIDYGQRYVDFVFSIFNQSVYDVTIDDGVGEGDIIFNKHPLVGVRRIEENRAQNIQPRSSGHFTVRQYLDSGDIAAIKDARGDRIFEFRNLHIKIKGGAGFENVVHEKRLQFDGSLSKDEPVWFDYNGPYRVQFTNSITGKINVVYFQYRFEDEKFSPNEINQYTFYFILHTYISNHGAPTGIERFRLVLRANGQSYESQRVPLTGCRWIRPGAEEPLNDRDIEDQNDVALSHTRRGWLQFMVSGVKRSDTDRLMLEMELDVIDKYQIPNRLTSMPQDKWIENSMSHGDYINGPGPWRQF